jgi:hypothetical protein
MEDPPTHVGVQLKCPLGHRARGIAFSLEGGARKGIRKSFTEKEEFQLGLKVEKKKKVV